MLPIPLDSRVDSRFIAYQLKGPKFWEYMHGVLGDKSAQPNASASTISKAPIVFPPLAEQKAIAQFETEIRAERQMDGIQKAKERGVRFGRKKSLTEEQVTDLRKRREEGELIKTLMKDYGISKATVYRYLDDGSL